MPSENSSLDDLCQACPHPRRVHVHFGEERLPTCMYCTSINNAYDHVFELATLERVEEYRRAYGEAGSS